MTATQDMEMDMENDLPAVVLDIRYQAVTTLSEIMLARQTIGYIWHGTNPLGIFGLEVEEGGNVPLRHDEEVDSGAWLDAQFLAPLRTQGKELTVTEGTVETLELRAIEPPRDY